MRTQHNIEPVHFNVCLCVDWIGEAGELRDTTEVRDEVLMHVSTSGPSNVLVILKLLSAVALRLKGRGTYINGLISRLLRELSEGQKIVDLHSRDLARLCFLLFQSTLLRSTRVKLCHIVLTVE